MIYGLRDFLRRHRRKFLITGVVVSGTFIALKYAQRKIMELQERQGREFLEKLRRLQHFESTERICNQLIISMSAELGQAIIKDCSTDDLLQQLRDNPPNKLDLWEEMKFVAFTRLTVFIYATSMLVVALRIQLNVLGGYAYRVTASDGEKINIDEVQKEQYLLLLRNFLQDGGGLAELIRLIRNKVVTLMRQMSLTKRLSLADMEQLFWSLQMAINSESSKDPCSKMCRYLFPSKLPEHGYNNGDNNSLLQQMFNETLDLLESDDAATVCSNNVCRGFSLAVDAIAESMAESIHLAQKSTIPSSKGDDDCILSNPSISTDLKASTTSIENKNSTLTSSVTSNDSLLNINSVQIALAKLIPIVSGLTSKGFDSNSRPQNLPTSLTTFYVVAEKCKTLGANVYETFSTSPAA
uniref:Peroxisomal biogenesis factor 3 n=1 Tax=Glossina brevipalpis TaxID=37001 RepID=A0A1A9WE08_9MUSC